MSRKYTLQTASGRDEKYVTELKDNWKFGGYGLQPEEAFEADKSEWADVTLPHTWNSLDGEDGDGKYLRGLFWYHGIIVKGSEMAGKRVFMEFAGANTKAGLYVNGKMAGPVHKGGYTAFRVDITELLREGENKLDVAVDNSEDQEIAPISGDFDMCGGLFRSVFLIIVPELHIDLMDHGSSGLYLDIGCMRSKERPDDLGQIMVRCRVVNDSKAAKKATVRIKADGQAWDSEVKVEAGRTLTFSQKIQINEPKLWNGFGQGNLYEITAEILENGHVSDCVTDSCGFRYLWIDKEKGFFLNGHEYPLRGVNRHSFFAGHGNALTEDLHDTDMTIIKELGANAVRLCHYPQNDYFYDLCDREGIAVWTEIPLVNGIGTDPGFDDNIKQQLTELICQQYNRPSVFFWGLENEIGNGQSLTDPTESQYVRGAKELLTELDALAKCLDNTGRFTTQAVNRDYAMNKCCTATTSENVGWPSDILAWNVYPGWYPDENFRGSFAEVIERKRAQDSRPFGISEYGWGANPMQHDEQPALGENGLTAWGPWHPEEYQCQMHEEAVAFINSHKYLWGTFIWALFDFAVDWRNEGGQPGINDKGLVTADRKTKKDSFYLYKANWNKTEPFVYLTGRCGHSKSGKIKVYSNCDRVMVSVDGRGAQEMTGLGNGIFVLEDTAFVEKIDTITLKGFYQGEPVN